MMATVVAVAIVIIWTAGGAIIHARIVINTNSQDRSSRHCNIPVPHPR
jgi:hypothetical protein